MKTVKIRMLTMADRNRLSALIAKLADVWGNQNLLNIIQPEPEAQGNKGSGADDGKQRLLEIGIKIIRTLIEILEKETHLWFADLVGVSMDEFMALPFDTELEILTQLSEAPEVERFFTKASQLSKKINGYRNLFASKSEK
jgi:dihydroxyacetone kinase DhaKLM complex PTS-EIIA-like component DhaM